MKFLLALSILAVSTVSFAQWRHDHDTIRCYEPAQQGGRGELAYILKEIANEKFLKVEYPDGFKHSPLKPDGDCLENEKSNPGKTLRLCPGTGQSIRWFVPVDAFVDGSTTADTVYCHRDIEDYFED